MCCHFRTTTRSDFIFYADRLVSHSISYETVPVKLKSLDQCSWGRCRFRHKELSPLGWNQKNVFWWRMRLTAILLKMSEVCENDLSRALGVKPFIFERQWQKFCTKICLQTYWGICGRRGPLRAGSCFWIFGWFCDFLWLLDSTGRRRGIESVAIQQIWSDYTNRWSNNHKLSVKANLWSDQVRKCGLVGTSTFYPLFLNFSGCKYDGLRYEKGNCGVSIMRSGRYSYCCLMELILKLHSQNRLEADVVPLEQHTATGALWNQDAMWQKKWCSLKHVFRWGNGARFARLLQINSYWEDIDSERRRNSRSQSLLRQISSGRSQQKSTSDVPNHEWVLETWLFIGCAWCVDQIFKPAVAVGRHRGLGAICLCMSTCTDNLTE